MRSYRGLSSFIIASALLISAACGGGGGGGTPTSPAPVARGNVTVSSFEATGTRTSAGFDVRVVARLRETGGVNATINSVTIAFINNGANNGGASFTTPISDSNNRIAASTEVTTRAMTVNAPADVTYPDSVRVTVAYTDDNQNTGTNQLQQAIAALPAPPPALATVFGIVRSDQTGQPAGNVTVQVDSGTYAGRSSVTDGNGYYSIAGVQGALVLRSSGVGYVTSTRPVTVNGDTRFDFVITQSGPIGPQTLTFDGVISGGSPKCGTSVFDDPCQRHTVTVTGNGTLSAVLSWAGGTNDLDLEIWRGGSRLASSISASRNEETVSLIASPGTYEFRVLYYSGSTIQNYRLTVRTP